MGVGDGAYLNINTCEVTDKLDPDEFLCVLAKQLVMDGLKWGGWILLFVHLKLVQC